METFGDSDGFTHLHIYSLHGHAGVPRKALRSLDFESEPVLPTCDFEIGAFQNIGTGQVPQSEES